MLGTVSHEFIGDDKTVTVERVGDWETFEEAPGGVLGASGTLPTELMRAYPGVFTFGSIWRSRHLELDKTLYGGRLLDPAPDGDVMTIAARGWGAKPEKESNRLLVQNRNYSDLLSIDAEPFEIAAADAISVNISGGRVRMKVDGSGDNLDGQGQGINQVTSPRHKNGFLFWAPGVNIQWVAFQIDKSAPFEKAAGTDSGLELALLKGRGVGNYDNYTLVQQGTNPWRLHGAGVADGHEVSVPVTADADVVMLVMRNRTGQTTWISRTAAVGIRRWRVNGLGIGDHYSASNLIREVFERLALRDISVDANGMNVSPYDLVEGPYGEALDYVNLLTDWRHFIHDDGSGPYAEWGPWGPVWEVPEYACDVNFLPIDRYNAVRVPYRGIGGTSRSETIEANPNPFDGRVVYDLAALDTATPTRATARDMGQRIADYLAKLRYAGSVSISEVLDESRIPMSPHVVQAGSVLRFPHLDMSVRVSQLRRRANEVEITLPDGYPTVDRMIERRNRRLRVRGKY